MSGFDETYFERGLAAGVSCYSNYRWIPELTIPLAHRLIRHLDIKEHDVVLDFGCAKGYLVKAFRMLDIEAFGVDVSDYAVGQAPEDVKPYVKLITDKVPRHNGLRWDWCVAKDVLEHVEHAQLSDTLKTLRMVSKKVFVVVPLGDGKQYNVPAYEIDVTHKIRQSLDWWAKAAEDAGFCVKMATHRFGRIKDNYRQWETGNGFMVLHSEHEHPTT